LLSVRHFCAPNMFTKKRIIIGAAVITLLLLPFIAYYMSPAGSAAESANFYIEKGEGLREIAVKLERAGLIRSRPVFVFYSLFSGSASKFKSGYYSLRADTSVPSLMRLLVAGPAADIKITVREGDTLAQIEKKLVDAGVIKAGALSKFHGKSLEGFLFPDTYRFFKNSSADDVVKKFMTNFHQRAMPALSGANIRLADGKQLSVYELLTVASIIEKEVPFQEDRRLVAGLLYKRLSIGMGLQVDAAPDTYKYSGLPSRPIANPGLDAIRAATEPKASSYLYYLSDPKTRKTIFSKTFEEHKENKFKYLK